MVWWHRRSFASLVCGERNFFIGLTMRQKWIIKANCKKYAEHLGSSMCWSMTCLTAKVGQLVLAQIYHMRHRCLISTRSQENHWRCHSWWLCCFNQSSDEKRRNKELIQKLISCLVIKGAATDPCELPGQGSNPIIQACQTGGPGASCCF